MSYSYNAKKKVKKMIKRLSQITTTEYKKLRPEEVKGHKKIVEFMKEHDIKCSVA